MPEYEYDPEYCSWVAYDNPGSRNRNMIAQIGVEEDGAFSWYAYHEDHPCMGGFAVSLLQAKIEVISALAALRGRAQKEN